MLLAALIAGCGVDRAEPADPPEGLPSRVVIEGPASEPGFALGWSVTVPGDLDGDGIDDLVAAGKLGAVVVHGSRDRRFAADLLMFLGARDASPYGVRVAGAGDLDGDGLADLAIGAPDFNDYAGRVWIFRGDPGGVVEAAHRDGPELYASYGMSLGAGDFDGDDLDDLVVGAPGEQTVSDRGPSAIGRAYVYDSYYSTLTSATVYEPGADGDGALAMRAVGDTDGDGFDDAVLASDGVIRLLRGSSDGLLEAAALDVPADPDRERQIVAAGDVTGDGFADVIVIDRAVWPEPDEVGVARALLFRGSAAGLAATSDPAVDLPWGVGRTVMWPQLVAAGDLDGDGYGDLLLTDAVADATGGSVEVLRGSAAGISATPAETLLGTEDVEGFGSDVAVGDLDGDGHPDLVVGSPYAGAEGRVTVIFGE